MPVLSKIAKSVKSFLVGENNRRYVIGYVNPTILTGDDDCSFLLDDVSGKHTNDSNENKNKS